MTINSQISDIQITENEDAKITLCNPDGIDFLTIHLDLGSMWDIHEFCKQKLSYRKNNGENKKVIIRK